MASIFKIAARDKAYRRAKAAAEKAAKKASHAWDVAQSKAKKKVNGIGKKKAGGKKRRFKWVKVKKYV